MIKIFCNTAWKHLASWLCLYLFLLTFGMYHLSRYFCFCFSIFSKVYKKLFLNITLRFQFSLNLPFMLTYFLSTFLDNIFMSKVLFYIFNSFITEVAIIKKPVHWFALQFNYSTVANQWIGFYTIKTPSWKS